jgi:hypothetical protein
MRCEKCEELNGAEQRALRSLQEQRSINRQWGVARQKAAREVEQRLERAYTLVCAEGRLHRGQDHPEQGGKVLGTDVCIKLRQGRTSP